MTEGFFLFSLICGILWYGVVKRTTWMWSLGWVCLFLYSGGLLLGTLSLLLAANNTVQIIFSVLHFFGILAIFLGFAFCWFRLRSKFIPPDRSLP